LIVEAVVHRARFFTTTIIAFSIRLQQNKRTDSLLSQILFVRLTTKQGRHFWN
jgi:hypothetical protein